MTIIWKEIRSVVGAKQSHLNNNVNVLKIDNI